VCVVFLATALAACSSKSTPSTGAPTGPPFDGDAAATTFTAGGARPVTVFVPPGVTPTTRAPLLLLLAGATATGVLEDYYTGIGPVAASMGFVYAYPDPLPDPPGSKNLAWNATDACCWFDGGAPDDVAYLTSLVLEIMSDTYIDPKQIFLLGHSNGAFMAHRLACDEAPVFSGIVSFEGATWLDPSLCKPSAPVSVLDIHGTADQTIHMNGGVIPNNGVAYPPERTDPANPGAPGTIDQWLALDGCDPSAGTAGPDEAIVLDQTASTTTWSSGCKAGVQVGLWVVDGGVHVPTLTQPTFPTDTLSWLKAHARK
jgi:polyhydroxybutyrate depolymerase